MSEVNFSRSGLSEASGDYSTALKNVQEIISEIKKEFEVIKGKWTGENSEEIQGLFQNVSTCFDAIEEDLKIDSSFISGKAEAFNNLKI